MVRIAICDDNEKELENISQNVKQYMISKPDLAFSLSTFSSPLDLAEALEIQPFSIYLLDVVMPGIDGIDLGKLIRNQDDNAVIIYLTSSPDYALSAYRVQAFQYLVKPVDFHSLCPVFDNLLVKELYRTNASIAVKTPSGIYTVFYSALIFAECKAHRIYYHMANGRCFQSVTMRQSFLQSMQPLMQDPRFLKISSSYLINMDYVLAVDGNVFVMPGNLRLSISRRNAPERKRKYMEYILQKGESGRA